MADDVGLFGEVGDVCDDAVDDVEDDVGGRVMVYVKGVVDDHVSDALVDDVRVVVQVDDGYVRVDAVVCQSVKVDEVEN